MDVTSPTPLETAPAPLEIRPRREFSLFWRTFFFLSLLLLGSIVAWLQTFRALESEPRAIQSAQQLASLVNLSRAALRYSDSIARLSLIKTLADPRRHDGVRAACAYALGAHRIAAGVPALLGALADNRGEAQRLAICSGWLLNGWVGGLMAGVFLVLPGVVALLALSWLYAVHGDAGFVAGTRSTPFGNRAVWCRSHVAVLCTTAMAIGIAARQGM